jgi:ABC-type phosphate/phosphonate transport system permease subunit
MISVLAVEVGSVLPLAQSGLGPDFFQDRSNPDCVQRNGAFCFGWAADNIDRYVTPTLQHLAMVSVSVALGFVIALGLALLSHRPRSRASPGSSTPCRASPSSCS